MTRRRGRSKRQFAPPSFFRRRSTKWLVAAIVTLAIGLTLGALSTRGGDDAPDAAPTVLVPAQTETLDAPPTTSPAVSLPDIRPDPARLERAEVTHVVDGDTIDVLMGAREERVRYYGIDTPERGDACYREATDRNGALAGEAVLLLPDARERDSFGRLLRYVFDEEGRSVDARLIAEGLAHAWRDDGAYRDELVALEDQTEASGVGCLWQ